MDSVNFSAEERAERAKAFFNEGYNCAQSVALAFADITSLDEQMVATITAPFGGGMGRMREVCGTVSGMTFVAGAICPSSNPQNMEERKQNYALVQEFANKFRGENGDIVCRRLLGLEPREEAAESAMPSERTAEYYRKRPCVEYVASATRIVAEYLLANTTK